MVDDPGDSSADRGNQFLPVATLIPEALPRDLAALRVALGQERRRALGARLRHRARPQGERARRVVRARVEGLALASALLQELAAAAGQRERNPEGDRFGGLA